MGVTLAKGTQIAAGDAASPEAFTQVLGVTEVSLPNPETEDIETTDHDTTDATKEYVPGLIEPGDLSFLFKDDPDESSQTIIETSRAARSILNWQTTIPTTTPQVDVFPAYVKSVEVVTEINGIVMKRATLKVAGA